MATDAEGQSRQGMDIPSLSLFKFVSGIPAVLDLRVLSGSDGSRRVSRRSMKGAEQSYKHQTDEWQCELHRDPFISARALKQRRGRTTVGARPQWKRNDLEHLRRSLCRHTVMEEQDLMRSFVPAGIPAFIA
jgi:hypothetical protein